MEKLYNILLNDIINFFYFIYTLSNKIISIQTKIVIKLYYLVFYFTYSHSDRYEIFC